VKERERFENDLLVPNYHLLKALIAMLNERVARVQFKQVSNNQVRSLTTGHIHTVEIEAEIDLMFEGPGILLSHGSQRSFTKLYETSAHNLAVNPLL
jgi:uncharacterized ubiquitin-like protein YukD